MEPLGPELDRELRRLGSSGALSELVRAWPRLVGEAIARNAFPARLTRDGTLRIHTSSSTWAFELTQLAAEIEARLREELGEQAPVRLRFVPGPLPSSTSGSVPEPASGRPSIGAEQRRQAAELARGIDDPALRELVARAAAASLAAAASGRRF
jgi:predicted nucleic acid-binding Zn ribbon protein